MNTPVDISVSSVSLAEFLRGIANESGLNINIDPSLNQVVSNNFSNVKVRDIILFVEKNYNVEVSFIGSIFSVKNKPFITPPAMPMLVLDYKEGLDLFSIEANGVGMEQLAREITLKTGKNVVVTPELHNINVRAFIRDMPFNNAMDKIAVGNSFKVKQTEDGFYLLEPVVVPFDNNKGFNDPSMGNKRRNTGSGSLVVKVHNRDSIDIMADNAALADAVAKILDPLALRYQILGEVNENVNLNGNGFSLDEVLAALFAGTKTAFKKVEGFYWIGPRDMLEMQEVRIVSMQYRTVDSLLVYVPENMKRNVDIKEYPDQNSVIISGNSDRVESLANFLKSMDKIVPVVLIEVLIIDNKNSKALNTGIKMGLGEKPVTSSGTIHPGVDMTLGSQSVNQLIDGLNGFGWINLGKVTPNFYMTLKALEEDGFIELQSTPQLATLNGHKASMSIGKTEYYKEELNTMYGSVTTSSQKVTTYKPVDAELKLVLKPIVSGNQEVTLDIQVEQSDFTDRISEFAPPGKVSRKFQSLIRVKDQEMILMGGLEENTKRETRSGFPILSRIPILHWFFSSKSKTTSKSKLNIFIKPTIII